MTAAENPFAKWEAPSFRLGDRVRELPSGRRGEVYGFMAWTPPVLVYAVLLEDGERESFTLSDLESAEEGRG